MCNKARTHRRRRTSAGNPEGARDRYGDEVAADRLTAITRVRVLVPSADCLSERLDAP